ncbi:hypothetical protein DCS_02721 [Drechmeria coniospora]|uniref:DUF1754-domain-containing protein n=1 Tax=Drechmeria coniospora TaxID=98403 RepID=A0A151GWV2_DRECN|nr:hypothetical protein DCS_02721 [Drechmeria coniospora]KYK61578.1 hypothetical protein DCS_02721 [Drechmeria coniospora]
MPSDDYTAVGGGGALRMKGAKVQKKKKKKDKSALGKGLLDSAEKAMVKQGDGKSDKRPTSEDREADEDDCAAPVPQKTESERRYEEVKRKRLLDMTKSSGSRPELLKTHKERVEQLNTYLSKLSEHHDMPKIGPG